MNKQKYMCKVCGYVYDPELGDPEHGIAPGTPFSEIPHEWLCPKCKKGKRFFHPVRPEYDPSYSSVDEADFDKVLLS